MPFIAHTIPPPSLSSPAFLTSLYDISHLAFPSHLRFSVLSSNVMPSSGIGFFTDCLQVEGKFTGQALRLREPNRAGMRACPAPIRL
ncbi:MAG: hypothetical protein V2G51_02260 [bacterium JZ-2024 1]